MKNKILKNTKIIICIFLIFIILIMGLLISSRYIKSSNYKVISKKNTDIKAEYEGDPNVEVITFEDENMAKALWNSLSGEEDAFPSDYTYLSGKELPILKTKLESTKKLKLTTAKEDSKISDISGIEKFTNLEELILSNNKIEDISHIKTLTKLKNLNLEGNKIQSVGNLSNLTLLEDLNLGSNRITSLVGIDNLTNIKKLNISNNEITSAEIDTIKNLYNLEVLDASYNQINSISNFLVFFKIKELNLYQNNIDNLEGIAGSLSRLEKLNLGNNKLETNQVKYIFETYKKADSKYYAKLENLKSLTLDGNKITDLFTTSNLEYMKILEELSAQDNGISSLNNLYKLETLKTLNLNGNKINSLDYLFKTKTNSETKLPELYLVNLINVSLSDNQIEDIYYNVKYSKDGTSFVKRFSFADFANLETLNLSQNKIYDISTIAYEKFKSIQLFEQDINLTIQKREENDDFQEVILPNIFRYTLDNSSNVATSQEYSYENCSKTSEDEKISNKNVAFVNSNYLANKTSETKQTEYATVTINGGWANGTIIHIDSSTSTTTSGPLETIAFTDENLYKKVRNNIMNCKEIDPLNWCCLDELNLINIYNKSAGLLSLKELDASSGNIEKLDGIKRLTALTDLNLEKNKITNIGEIALLKNLIKLNVSANQINNLSEFNYVIGSANRKNKQNMTTKTLESKSKLTTLLAYTNNISEIEPLSECKKLTELNLLQNQIEDIDKLQVLTELKILNLGNNKISNLSAIETLVKLVDLNLANNSFAEAELKSLKNLSVIETLDLSLNNLKDLSEINKLTTLKTLMLNKNAIENVNDISNLTKLRTLDVSSNKINNLDGIKNLYNLTRLDLSKNKIQDISKMQGFASLTYLDASLNSIKDPSIIEELEKSYSLSEVYLNDQIITIELTPEQISSGSTVEINLPVLFEHSQIENNLVYTDKNLKANNCSINENKILIPSLDGKIATVQIQSGLADGSKVNIAEPLKGIVKYSTESLTNQDVNATIEFNRANVSVTNNKGSNSYTFTENGEFTFEFEDEFGFTGTAKATVNWIDKTAPIIEISYDEDKVNNKTLVTITANEEIKPVSGWTLSTDKKVLTKEYTEQVTENVEIYDVVGNKSIAEINIGKAIITNISIKTNPTKINYYVGDTLNTEGMVITATYSDGTTKEITEGFTCSLTKLETAGTQEIIVTYGGKTAKFNVSVTEKVVEQIFKEASGYETEEGYITKVTNKTAVSTFKSNVTSGYTVEILKNDKTTKVGSGNIGTGMYIIVNKGTEKVGEYQLVITGDLNGDGELKNADLLKLARYQAKLDTNLKDAYLKAADVYKDGINADNKDILKLARILAGLDNL